MKNKDKLEKLFKDSEDAYLVVTKNGTGIVGNNVEIITLLSMLLDSVRNLDGINDKDIDRAVEISRLSTQETLEKVTDALEALKNLIKEM